MVTMSNLPLLTLAASSFADGPGPVVDLPEIVVRPLSTVVDPVQFPKGGRGYLPVI